MVTKDKKKLEEQYYRCIKNLINIDNSLYKEYESLAYEDLDSAKNEENARWAVTKAYQALFMMCNSILVRKVGFYSKDHGCLILALMYNNLITEKILLDIHEMLKNKEKLFSEMYPNESFFEEISNIRIDRNKYLYLPKTLRKPEKSSNEIIEEVRELIKFLAEIR